MSANLRTQPPAPGLDIDLLALTRLDEHPLVIGPQQEWQAQQTRVHELEAHRRQVEVSLYEASHSDTLPAESPGRLRRRRADLLDAIEEARFDLRPAWQRLEAARTAAVGELWDLLAVQARPLLARLEEALEGVCQAQEAVQTLAHRCRGLGVELPLVSAFDGGSTAQRQATVHQAQEALRR